MSTSEPGELCLRRAKLEETQMEARSGTDVQIVIRGYKGARLIDPLVPSKVSFRIAGVEHFLSDKAND